MRKIMIVDDNYLSAEGIEKNIDWEVLNAEIVHICYNGTSAIDAMKKEQKSSIEVGAGRVELLKKYDMIRTADGKKRGDAHAGRIQREK